MLLVRLLYGKKRPEGERFALGLLLPPLSIFDLDDTRVFGGYSLFYDIGWAYFLYNASCPVLYMLGEKRAKNQIILRLDLRLLPLVYKTKNKKGSCKHII